MEENQEIQQRINYLIEHRNTCSIAAEDVFWSPQEKEKYLNEIDKELEELRNGI